MSGSALSRPTRSRPASRSRSYGRCRSGAASWRSPSRTGLSPQLCNNVFFREDFQRLATQCTAVIAVLYIDLFYHLQTRPGSHDLFLPTCVIISQPDLTPIRARHGRACFPPPESPIFRNRRPFDTRGGGASVNLPDRRRRGAELSLAAAQDRQALRQCPARAQHLPCEPEPRRAQNPDAAGVGATGLRETNRSWPRHPPFPEFLPEIPVRDNRKGMRTEPKPFQISILGVNSGRGQNRVDYG